MDLRYRLLKYRGLQTDNNTTILQLLHFNSLLYKDGKDQALDPFMYKIIVQPPPRK